MYVEYKICVAQFLPSDYHYSPQKQSKKWGFILVFEFIKIETIGLTIW